MNRLAVGARERIRSMVQHTPTIEDGSVFYKCENLQTTGSFKLRGASAKLTALSDVELSRGVVTASTGNHGAAVAHAGREVGTAVTVFVPENADRSKVERIRTLGAAVEVVGTDSVVTERVARTAAEGTGRTYIPPYNDLDVIAGQGTIGLELREDVGDLDVIFIAVGGGGLLSGVGSVLRARHPDIRIVACSPENSAVVRASLEAGSIVDIPSADTLSDGTHGGVEAGAITYEFCRDLIDDFVLVSEAEIAEAMTSFMDRHQMRIEGSAGVAIAANRQMSEELGDSRAGIILCGGNVSDEVLASLATKSG